MEAKMCVNRLKCVSEVMKLNVGKSQRRENHSEPGSREVTMRNQKESGQYMRALAVGMSVW